MASWNKDFENFEDFVSKLAGQRYENALKAWFLKRKSYFLSVKPQNFRACGAATLSATPKKFAPAARLLPNQLFKNISHVVQKVIIQKQLSDDVHKVIIQKQLSGDVQKQLFKSNYPVTFKSNYSKAIIQKDWWRSKAIIHKINYSIIVHEAATTQAIFKFVCGYRALYTCTKRLEKKNCAAGAKNLKYKS